MSHVRWLVAAALVTAALSGAAPARAGTSVGNAPPPAPPEPPAAVVVDRAGLDDAGRAVVYGNASGGSRIHPRFAVSLPVWVPGVTGTIATGTSQASTSGDFLERFVLAKETVSELKFAFVGRVEASWDRWWLLADLFGATVGAGVDWTYAQQNTQVDISALIGRVVVGYEAWRRPACGPACFALTPYAGLRFFDVDLTINGTSASRAWAMAIVGAEAKWALSWRWTARLLVDGGIPVDSASGHYWSASAEVGYRFSHLFSAFAGYTVLDVRYDRDEGNRFLVDLTLAGPQLGITFDF